ncbi:MAG TPA: exodeoxyribonuclease VII small subunit [Porticoccaceae bacterium]|nr:exodeoxyribonuclease VII small subunit [Porticoccaceae bacterium]
MAARKKTLDFETGLSQLEAIVEALEGGKLGLDDALRSFEQGVGVARQCQQALRDAEQRVQLVMQNETGEFATAPFTSTDEADPE